MTQRIAILGSTGSIGRNALRVIDALGEGFEVAALSGHTNMALLAKQVAEYRPQCVAITHTAALERFQYLTQGLDVEVLAGPDALVRLVEDVEVDTVLMAIVGAAGLAPSLAAARLGKRLAIANKEPLVLAGELLTRTAKAHHSQIVPVDSEHSAIFQALQAGRPEEVQRIILTASGGPFRKASSKDLEQVTREQALAHPVWAMGPKITIDSATLINKALEIIEARWLFETPVDRIEVLIHPESIIHSLVEFVDGSVIAQLGHPDMGLPIQYALTYPLRLAGVSRRLRLEELGHLTFEKADPKTFRALALAYDVARLGGTAPAVFNAANEAAVHAFLEGTVRFTQILELIEHCLNAHDLRTNASLEDLLAADTWAREEVCKKIRSQGASIRDAIRQPKRGTATSI